MTKFDSPVQSGPLRQKPARVDQAFIPPWVRFENRYAQNLLEASDDPIEYDHDDEDYRDNCFFFPEDCTWSPPKDWVIRENGSSENLNTVTDACFDNHKHDTMIPGLPDIKMLDSEALGGLLEDNLSPPEITSILYGVLGYCQRLLADVCIEYLLPTELYLHMLHLTHRASCAT